jgi:hypothetical protein
MSVALGNDRAIPNMILDGNGLNKKCTAYVADIIERVELWREPSMYAEELLVHDGSEW